jgi:hypothetical protein
VGELLEINQNVEGCVIENLVFEGLRLEYYVSTAAKIVKGMLQVVADPVQIPSSNNGRLNIFDDCTTRCGLEIQSAERERKK